MIVTLHYITLHYITLHVITLHSASSSIVASIIHHHFFIFSSSFFIESVIIDIAITIFDDHHVTIMSPSQFSVSTIIALDDTIAGGALRFRIWRPQAWACSLMCSRCLNVPIDMGMPGMLFASLGSSQRCPQQPSATERARASTKLAVDIAHVI